MRKKRLLFPSQMEGYSETRGHRHCEVSEEEKNDPEFLAFIEREMERRKKLEHGN